MGFLPLAAAWFVGDSVAALRRYLAGLADQAERERAAEAERARQEVREERVRIARELHDVVAHTLAVITVQAGVGRRLMAKRPEEAGAALESIEMIGRTAQDELRVVLGLLRDEEAGAPRSRPRRGSPTSRSLRTRCGPRGTGRAANVGHHVALPGARAHALPGCPGGAHQHREACAASTGHGRPRRLGHLRPPRGHRRWRITGRTRPTDRPGLMPPGLWDRRDARADRRVRRVARRRAVPRRGFPGCSPRSRPRG